MKKENVRADFSGFEFSIGDVRSLDRYMLSVDCFTCAMFDFLIVVSDKDFKFIEGLAMYLEDRFLWFTNNNVPKYVALIKRVDGLFSHHVAKDHHHNIGEVRTIDNSLDSKILLIETDLDDTYEVIGDLIEEEIKGIEEESRREIERLRKIELKKQKEEEATSKIE